MRTKSEDPDEMPHIAAFHHGLQFATTKTIFRESNILFGNYNLDIYNEPYQTRKKNSSVHKGLIRFIFT